MPLTRSSECCWPGTAVGSGRRTCTSPLGDRWWLLCWGPQSRSCLRCRCAGRWRNLQTVRFPPPQWSLKGKEFVKSLLCKWHLLGVFLDNLRSACWSRKWSPPLWWRRWIWQQAGPLSSQVSLYTGLWSALSWGPAVIRCIHWNRWDTGGSWGALSESHRGPRCLSELNRARMRPESTMRILLWGWGGDHSKTDFLKGYFTNLTQCWEFICHELLKGFHLPVKTVAWCLVTVK